MMVNNQMVNYVILELNNRDLKKLYAGQELHINAYAASDLPTHLKVYNVDTFIDEEEEEKDDRNWRD